MKIPNRKTAIKRDVQHRQAMKKKWDKRCQYSTDEEFKENFAATESHDFDATYDFQAGGDNWTRLLDEGVVVDGGDDVFAVLQKGVIKRFYDELPDNFEGYIDKDHIRAIYLGKYTKEDLRLVELEDDRYALEVNIKLDRSLYAVQDLIRQDEHRALSVEMMMKADEFAKVSKVTGMSEKEVQAKFGWDYLVPIVHDIGIMGFAICENPKNANSYNDNLLENASVKENTMPKKNEAMKNLEAEEAAKTQQAEDATDDADEQADKDADDAPANEPAEGAAGNDTDDNATDEPEAGAEETDEDDEDKSGEEGDAEGEGVDKYAKLEEAIADMKAKLEAKDEEIAKLQEQLESKKTAELSSEDRLTELLNFATSATRSNAEGATTKTEGDDFLDVFKEAFAEEQSK